MLTLGLETSGLSGSIALLDESNGLTMTELSPTGRRHARTLVAELQRLFESTGRSPSECTAIAVSIGPGSFTGLRVGVVAAKTLAYALERPVIAVDTLEAIAASAPADAQALDVVMDALRGELFYARYHRAQDDWQREGEVTLLTAVDVLSRTREEIPVTGPGLAKWPLEQRPARCLPSALWTPTAAAVARIGQRREASGLVDDLWGLEPYYLRLSAAEERWAATRPKNS